MNTATAGTLAQYRAWADALTYETVAALPPGEAVKERPTLQKPASLLESVHFRLIAGGASTPSCGAGTRHFSLLGSYQTASMLLPSGS
jgi:hypothetical protein